MLLRIRRVIKEYGKTQEGFAALVKVPRESVNRWANGRSAISAESAERIAQATGLPTDLFAPTPRASDDSVEDYLARFAEQLATLEAGQRELAALVEDALAGLQAQHKRQVH